MPPPSLSPTRPRQRRAFCRTEQPRRARQTYSIGCNIGNRTTSQEVNSGEDYPVESVLYHLAEQTYSFGRSIGHTLTREDKTNPLLTVTTGYAPDGRIDADGDGSLNAGFNSEIGADLRLTVGVSDNKQHRSQCYGRFLRRKRSGSRFFRTVRSKRTMEC